MARMRRSTRPDLGVERIDPAGLDPEPPVGDRAQFRLQKDKMRLRLEDLDSKEREYFVVSMTPRIDSTAADATSIRLNHLQ